METKIYLSPDEFSRGERLVCENGALRASTFTYSTGVQAVCIANARGHIVMLPFMGQMIWRMAFCDRYLVMRSIYAEPQPCQRDYTESYGCFMMHCGLTAMGNPSAEDDHLPHGELPVAHYQRAYLLSGEDTRGRYIALGGVYTHRRAYEYNYAFSPEVRLYEDATTVDITVNIKNNKDLPLEYFYLCHLNYRPVDGARLVYTARHENIVAHREVPDGYPEPAASRTREYLDRLAADMSVMDTVDSTTQSYAPEIVFTCRYDADEAGDAHTLQILPDGYACYVRHRPEELPFGIRWISRTADEDAMGMVLPATAEHKGYRYCKERGYERYLASGDSVTYHITTGILTPSECDDIVKKIK